MLLVKDIERYPTMTTFVLYRFKGEILDYDFEKEHRNYKLERKRFSFGGMAYVPAGFTIDAEKCLACGKCAKVCTFNAIIPGIRYTIDGSRCDECGSCYAVCAVGAAVAICSMEENDRMQCGDNVLAYKIPEKR